MKLIDIMKQYNRCILKENAKLRSIYNTLIRECDDANECDANECDANECDANECDAGQKMSIAEFLGECDDKETDECDKCGDDSCKDGEKCGLKEGDIEEDEDKVFAKEQFYAIPETDKEDVEGESEDLEEEEDVENRILESLHCNPCLKGSILV